MLTTFYHKCMDQGVEGESEHGIEIIRRSGENENNTINFYK